MLKKTLIVVAAVFVAPVASTIALTVIVGAQEIAHSFIGSKKSKQESK